VGVWRSDWRYCPRCASALEFGPREGEGSAVLHCTSCGLVIYDNPAPTASALVLDQSGRLMLTRRAKPPAQEMWDVPGGFIEPGEHPEQAVRRELMEETGLTVEVGDRVGFFCDTYGDDGMPTLNIVYRARVTGGVERAADDVSEIGWFPLGELPSGEEIAFESGRRAIAALVGGDAGKKFVQKA
jgi:8-oxo-dGTP diphosphatase